MKVALILENRKGFLLAPVEMEPTLLELAKDQKARLYRMPWEGSVPTISDVVTRSKDAEAYMKELPGTPRELIYEPPAPKRKKNKTVITKGNYKDHTSRADLIKDHIKGRLMQGESLSLEKVQKWATSQGIELSKGGLSRHLQKCIEWAIERGYRKVKEGREYRIEKESIR